MCSNFDRLIKDKQIQKELKAQGYPAGYDDKFSAEDYANLKQEDIKITGNILIVKKEETKPVLSIMKWGISWNPRMPIFNSRIETIREQARWKSILMKGRCLIPATAFYEYRPLDSDTPDSKAYKKEHKIKKKTKFGITIPGCKFFFIGAIYVWDKTAFCCSMITTKNHPELGKIPHHRSPYLIEPQNAQEFLEADPLYLLDSIDVYDKTKTLDIKQVTEY